MFPDPPFLTGTTISRRVSCLCLPAPGFLWKHCLWLIMSFISISRMRAVYPLAAVEREGKQRGGGWQVGWWASLGPRPSRAGCLTGEVLPREKPTDAHVSCLAFQPLALHRWLCSALSSPLFPHVLLAQPSHQEQPSPTGAGEVSTQRLCFWNLHLNQREWRC